MLSVHIKIVELNQEDNIKWDGQERDMSFHALSKVLVSRVKKLSQCSFFYVDCSYDRDLFAKERKSYPTITALEQDEKIKLY